MNSLEKAERFAALHIKGSPLVLYNAWDAGSAKAVCDAGAPAIATSSWAVAAAHGYTDGEKIPMHLVEQIIARIVATTDIPVTVDFEGGYSDDDDDTLTGNVARLLDLGVIGINFEDRVVSGKGLYSVERQSRRIEAIRKMADKRGAPLFINARTDLFLGAGASDDLSALLEAATRGVAYAQAGASGFFVPGLRSDALIGELCRASALPVNVMVTEGLPSASRLAELGVARISYGPAPFIEAIEKLKAAAGAVYAQNSSAVTKHDFESRALITTPT
jgi:2-methylisocitrate lyase-like PEP mutase family enzyme